MTAQEWSVLIGEGMAFALGVAHLATRGKVTVGPSIGADVAKAAGDIAAAAAKPTLDTITAAVGDLTRVVGDFTSKASGAAPNAAGALATLHVFSPVVAQSLTAAVQDVAKAGAGAALGPVPPELPKDAPTAKAGA